MRGMPSSLSTFVAMCNQLSLSREVTECVQPIQLSRDVIKGMNPKKRHEVARMAELVTRMSLSSNCPLVVDVGAGLGYLSAVIAAHPALNVLALECREMLTHGTEARGLDQGLRENLDALTFNLQDNEDNFLILQEILVGKLRDCTDYGNLTSQTVHFKSNLSEVLQSENNPGTLNLDKDYVGGLGTLQGHTAVDTPGTLQGHTAMDTPGTLQGHTTMDTPGTLQGHTTMDTPGTLLGHTTVDTPGTLQGHTAMDGPGTLLGHTTMNTPGTLLGHTTVDTPGTLQGHTTVDTPSTLQGHTAMDTPGTLQGHTAVDTPGTLQGHTTIDGPGSPSTTATRTSTGISQTNNAVGDTDTSVTRTSTGTIQTHKPTGSPRPSLTPAICLIGLHCCGSLTPTMMKMFLSTPDIRSFVCISCCYHSLHQKADNTWTHFPMSQVVRDVLKSKLPDFMVSVFGMRLAAQETRSHWASQSEEDHVFHRNNVCFRALLQLVCEKEGLSVRKEKRHIAKRKDMRCLDTYIAAVVERTSLGKQCPDIGRRLHDLQTKYAESTELIEPFTGLQVALQPVLESLILVDRVLFLREAGVYVQLVPIFQDIISPRNMAIVAEKRH